MSDAGSVVQVSRIWHRMSSRTAMAHRNPLCLLSMKELRIRYETPVLDWALRLLNPISKMLQLAPRFNVTTRKPETRTLVTMRTKWALCE